MQIPYKYIFIITLLTLGCSSPPVRAESITLYESTEAPQTYQAHPQAPELPQTPIQPAQSLTAVQETPAPAPTTSAPVSGCGDNQYANYIYMHESGCRTTATNPSGCYGIGQACPASKIAHCGADYACQNAFFSSYANSRYGGWAGAYAFWLENSWW